MVAMARRKHSAPTLLALCALLLLGGCERWRGVVHWDCKAQGEVFRYRDGQRLGDTSMQPIAFKLTTYAQRDGFKLDRHAVVPELSASNIVRDTSRSNPVEWVYLHDSTDPVTNFRTVSSLVLNTTSGDVRLFHRRWVPPVEWRDSDQYTFSGNCRRKRS
jgi:hypothetical protein